MSPASETEVQRRTRENVAARIRSAQNQVDNAVEEAASAVNASVIASEVLVNLCLAKQFLASAGDRAAAPAAPLEAGHA